MPTTQPCALLLLVGRDWRVETVSANVGMLGDHRPASVIGQPLADLIGSKAFHTLRNRLSWLASDESAHVTGAELLEGIRQFALEQFGLMTRTVFRRWGIFSTDDFGRIVFELIDRGELRKTERDQLSDFFSVYEFEDVFDREYRVDTAKAFQEWTPTLEGVAD